MFNWCARYFDTSDVDLVICCYHTGAIGKYAYLTYIQLADYCLALYYCTPGMLMCQVAMHGADVAC